MIGILGIIMPLLVTVYASDTDKLNLDSGLFTLFFWHTSYSIPVEKIWR